MEDKIIMPTINKWSNHENYLKYHREYYQNNKQKRNNDRRVCIIKKRIKKLQLLLSKHQYLAYIHSQIKEWQEIYKDELNLDQIIIA